MDFWNLLKWFRELPPSEYDFEKVLTHHFPSFYSYSQVAENFNRDEATNAVAETARNLWRQIGAVFVDGFRAISLSVGFGCDQEQLFRDFLSLPFIRATSALNLLLDSDGHPEMADETVEAILEWLHSDNNLNEQQQQQVRTLYLVTDLNSMAGGYVLATFRWHILQVSTHFFA